MKGVQANPFNPSTREQRWEDHEFQASLGYTARRCLNKLKTNKNYPPGMRCISAEECRSGLAQEAYKRQISAQYDQVCSKGLGRHTGGFSPTQASLKSEQEHREKMGMRLQQKGQQ
jgi:hypothetical protein